MRSIRHFFRIFAAQRSIGFFSVFGLAIGIAIALLISLRVWEEFQFDHFHEEADHIYRVYATLGEEKPFTVAFRQVGDNAKNELPEVKDVCRLVQEGIDIKIGELIFPDNELMQTDENFFNFFTFPLKYGNKATCMQHPDNMVISEKLAHRLFPGENPVGKTVKSTLGKEWKISAVMYDMPYHSHIQADMIVPIYGERRNLQFGNDNFITYLNIPQAADVTYVEQRINELFYRWAPELRLKLKYKLQPMKEVHFSGIMSAHMGDKTGTYILILSAGMILILACINFVNLFISASFLRAREIGVKKAMGVKKGGLVRGFYLETFYYVILAVILGCLLALVCAPLFNRLTGYHFVLDFTSPRLYICLILLIGVIMLLAGSFPAFYMTKYPVIETLSGQFKGKNLSILQKSLVVTQFTFSIIFLISALFIQKQVKHMIEANLGIEKENIVCVRAKLDILKNYKKVYFGLNDCPFIKDVCLRCDLPLSFANGSPISKEGEEQAIHAELCEVQSNYFGFMGLRFIQGDSTVPGFDAKNYIVLNETAVKQLGLTDPLQSTITFWGKGWIVKGVVADVHDKGIGQNVIPQVYMPCRPNAGDKYMLMCKVTGNPQKAIEALQKQWETYNPGEPFNYYFLDDLYTQLYEAETRLGNVGDCAMVIMMLISITGLFAMAYYSTQRRIKEIGIRKVNGATLKNLLLLLNAGFLKWMLIAYLIACPVSMYIIWQWLNNFTYRISLNVWLFLLAGTVSMIIALATVCLITWKVARMNPVHALRSE